MLFTIGSSPPSVAMSGSLGYLNLSIASADLVGCSSSSAKVKILISSDVIKDDRPISIMRTVVVSNNKTRDMSRAPIDIEKIIDIRCSRGWIVELEILVFDRTGSRRLCSEPVVVGETEGGTLPLYQNNCLTGSTVNLMLDYFPNHEEMYCLSRDCILESYLSRHLTESLAESLQEEMATRTAEGETVSKYLEAIGGASQRLLDYVEEGLLGQLLGKYLQDVIGEGQNTIHYTSETLLRHDVSLPETVETFRAISCAKHFLKHLLKEFKMHSVPDPSVYLVEKLLTNYMDATRDVINESESTRSPNNWTHLDESLTFNLFMDFVLVASIWYLQHVLIYSKLSEQFKISPVELNALWTRLVVYDSKLSGHIGAVDLALLLQDMGEIYSPQEVAFILSELDPDDIGIVEFGGLIKWWCSE